MPGKGSFDLDSVTPEELQAMVDDLGGQRAFSRKYGVPRATLQLRLHKIERVPYGHRPAPEPRRINLSAPIARFILTSAQDETELHHYFLDNLEAYRDWLARPAPARSRSPASPTTRSCSRTTTRTTSPIGTPGSSSTGCRNASASGEQHRLLRRDEHPADGGHAAHRVRDLHPPPLGHLPAREGAASLGADDEARAGQADHDHGRGHQAELRAQARRHPGLLHHTLGAVLVEIAADGTFFCRHLLAEDDGSFYDLDRHVKTNVRALTPAEKAERRERLKGTPAFIRETGWRPNYDKEIEPIITTGNRIEAINWGDLHVAQIDPEVAKRQLRLLARRSSRTRRACGSGARRLGEPILLTRCGRSTSCSTTSRLPARNHHNIRDAHHMYALYCEGVDTVEDELREVGTFIEKTKRPFCETVVVESNHDLALKRWLGGRLPAGPAERRVLPGVPSRRSTARSASAITGSRSSSTC
jgi:hypothetical protein